MKTELWTVRTRNPIWRQTTDVVVLQRQPTVRRRTRRRLLIS